MAENYTFTNVSAIINGHPIVDWADDDAAIHTERNADTVLNNIGADGSLARALSNDLTGTVSFVLKQTSDTNGFLDALINAGEAINSFINIELTVRDSQRNDVILAVNGAIMRSPDLDRGRNITNRTWVIHCERLVIQQKASATTLAAAAASIAANTLLSI